MVFFIYFLRKFRVGYNDRQFHRHVIVNLGGESVNFVVLAYVQQSGSPNVGLFQQGDHAFLVEKAFVVNALVFWFLLQFVPIGFWHEISRQKKLCPFLIGCFDQLCYAPFFGNAPNHGYWNAIREIDEGFPSIIGWVWQVSDKQWFFASVCEVIHAVHSANLNHRVNAFANARFVMHIQFSKDSHESRRHFHNLYFVDVVAQLPSVELMAVEDNGFAFPFQLHSNRKQLRFMDMV